MEVEQTSNNNKTKHSNRLEYPKISKRALMLLLDTIKSCEVKIETINLNDNSVVDEEVFKSLCEYIQNNKSIKHLNFTEININNSRLSRLVDALVGNTSISTLNLSRNKLITDTSVSKLLNLVAESTLTTIKLGETSISPENVEAIKLKADIPIDQRTILGSPKTKSASKASE